MKISRRDLLFASGVSLIAGTRVFGHATGVVSPPQSQNTGSPAVVSAVRAAWPNPDRESDTILRTLEESLAINAVARTGSAWASSERRAQWKRNNLAAWLREEQGRESPPKVMLKFGYNHMIRGANYFNIFDVGAMTD